MSSIEEGRKFTEDCYASKEDVQAYYNMDNVTNYWNHILYYRSFFDVQTKLRNTDGNFFKICLSKTISYLSYNLQMDLMADFVLYQSLSLKKKNKFLLSRSINALKAVCRMNQLVEPSNEILTKLSNQEMESVPNSLFVLDIYSKACANRYIEKGLTMETIESINKMASGESPDSECIYRTGPFSDLVNPLQRPEPTKIHSLMKDFLSFLNEEKIPMILKAIVIPFTFLYIKPFDYSNEETAALLSKNYLYSKGLGDVGFFLDLESIAFSRGKETFQCMLKSQKSLDLTYFVHRCLPYLIEDEKKIRNQLASLKDEFEDSVEKNKEQENFEQQYALPVFPTQSKSKEVDDIAIKLRQMYPQLKKKEAHFYAGHCTIGFKYTIEQFKEEEKTVYETARTSMDSLANRGLYKKEKSKNKFVYSPIPLKEVNK